MNMKMRLLTLAGLTTICFSAASYAGTPITAGSITNEKTTSADITFNQPITMINHMNGLHDLQAGLVAENVKIAEGAVVITKGGPVRVAIKMTPTDGPFVAYESGHNNEEKYKLTYKVLPKDASDKDTLPAGFSLFSFNGASYAVGDNKTAGVEYKLITDHSENIQPGVYSLNATVGVYNS